MAPVKRKAITDERPSKKAKADDGQVKEKSREKKTARKSQDGEQKEKKSALSSILQQEEKAFPRGGADVLSAIERKQIQAQAERDAQAEHEGGNDDEQDDGALFDEEAPAKKKSKKSKKHGDESGKKVDGSGIRIQGLSYKNVVVGSSLLGRVTAVTSKDIALALPNNLTGYVPITAISERLNARIERMLADDANPDADEDEEDIDLKQVVHVGQWLRATVTSMGTEASGKSKKHIELSIDPSQVNGGLDEENFVTNSTIQASVRSVEDRGMVMDLGLADETVKGFVSKKELGSSYQLDQIQEGQVMLCLITGKGSNGKVLKLCPDPNKFTVLSKEGKPPALTQAPTVDSFLPGTAVEMLVIESGPKGVAAKVMGMLDVTADVVHSGAVHSDDMSKKYKVGSKIKARLTYAIPKDDGSRRVGASLLDHTLAMIPHSSKLPVNATATLKSESAELNQPLPLSSIVEATVVRVSSDRGLFLSIPSKDGRRDQNDAQAFAHISQIADDHTDTISSTGPYKAETAHKARILSYNPVDNMYYMSLKKSVLDQSFLRLEDLPVGEVVKGTVDKLILGGPKGVTGVLVKISDNITGLVPEMHLSDAQLQHPERKFREGFPVKARVLSVDNEKRQVRLTLKRSLVEDDAAMWDDYKDLRPGMESKGTIINMRSNGAVVQFYGSIRAWLPVAEMSETFIEKPEQHFRLGQTVTVRIVSVTPESEEMKVTCKNDSGFEDEQLQAWNSINSGDLVTATVSEKTGDGLSLDLDGGLKGTVKANHLADGSAAKAEKELKRVRVGQKLANLLVLDKLDRSHTVMLSNKPSMIEDARSGKLIKSFSEVRQGKKAHGFVRNITDESVYVEFGNEIVGLLPKNQLLPEMLKQPAFGLRKDQTVAVWITSTDAANERFLLTTREQAVANAKPTNSAAGGKASNAVDSSIHSMADFELGKVVKARIASIKATQINVRLADDVQGRVDVSEAFDKWDDITNKAAPLQKFKQGDLIDVKILGIHDARNHRFLPISHRQGRVPVFELSAKTSRVKMGNESLLSLDTVKPGSTHLAFVNNHSDGCVWVNLSPNVRGRVALMDLSDDVGQLQNVENRFRIGCALRVKVKSVNVNSNRLDLTAKISESGEYTSLNDLVSGMVLAARVTKSSERLVHIQISDSISGAVPLVELSDDYDQANPAQHSKNDIVRVCVLGVDVPNKKAYFSLRPSKVLSSSLPVKDLQITDASLVKPGNVVRGFVKQIAEKGVFVSLGARIDALVRIADLSDQFVKDWKSIYQIDQLVKGRVLSVDPTTKQIQMSLKKSQVDGKYTPPLTINDLKTEMVVTGKVRKVEDFGAFIDIDNTQPRLSGLCHRSEVAARRIEDVRKLYSAGDVVKAMVLKVDVENRKISLGLKASYFKEGAEEDDEEESDNEDVDMNGVGLDGEDEESDADAGGVDLEHVEDYESDVDPDTMDVDEEPATKPVRGLKTSGFDWTGDTLDSGANGAGYESEPDVTAAKKRKRTKPEIKEDLTGDLDKYGPRSVSDFERQLLGQPSNSGLWIQYMAFQLQLSEVQKARDIAERALRTIHIRETEEKANIWIAWLNLEVEYGDNESVEEVFKQACQMQDPLEMHQKLASIYIDSGKHDKADAIFERIVGNKTFRASPDVWLNYASFLMDTLRAPVRARALLSRAMQSVPLNEHRLLTAKIAALEFRSSAGDSERGRTVFEGLLAEWPKWSSGWDMFVDLERSQVSRAQSADAKKASIEKARALFKRMADQKMKKRRAKFLFKKWLEFEEKEGNPKSAEAVKVLAKEYVEKMNDAGDDEEEE